MQVLFFLITVNKKIRSFSYNKDCCSVCLFQVSSNSQQVDAINISRNLVNQRVIRSFPKGNQSREFSARIFPKGNVFLLQYIVQVTVPKAPLCRRHRSEVNPRVHQSLALTLLALEHVCLPGTTLYLLILQCSSTALELRDSM